MMRLDPECIRNILLDIEELHDYPNYLYLDQDTQWLRTSQYQFDKIVYHCILLEDADFLKWSPTFTGSGNLYHAVIRGLTYDGHQFLETVRNPQVWEDTKSITKKMGSFSLDVISSVASSILTDLMMKQL